MHTSTQRELQYELEDKEVIDLAVSIANDLKNKGHFKEFLVEVEDLPYWDGYGDYALLKVHIKSDITYVVLGNPNNSDTIIVEQAASSIEGWQQLIERGNTLVDLLKVAMPDVDVKTDYPRIPCPEPEKPKYPLGSMRVEYKHQGNYFTAVLPSKGIGDKVIQVLQEQGCEVIKYQPAK